MGEMQVSVGGCGWVWVGVGECGSVGVDGCVFVHSAIISGFFLNGKVKPRKIPSTHPREHPSIQQVLTILTVNQNYT